MILTGRKSDQITLNQNLFQIPHQITKVLTDWGTKLVLVHKPPIKFLLLQVKYDVRSLYCLTQESCESCKHYLTTQE
jgi:hypothetical protein